jgi:3-deoxy-D-manno-octulosonate 8-phosphate phosphatase (KDO 8-P phosphatase)
MKLTEVSKKFESKLKKIKVAVFDVDGILTDAKVYYSGSEIGFNRVFNVYDGYGMKLLMQAGLKVGVLSGGDSIGLKERVAQLKLDFSYLGNEDKLESFQEIQKRYNVAAEEILYMGDELFDIPILTRSGFSATVSTAPWEIKEKVDYITCTRGGEGAAREVIDLVRYAQGIIPQFN